MVFCANSVNLKIKLLGSIMTKPTTLPAISDSRGLRVTIAKINTKTAGTKLNIPNDSMSSFYF